MYSRVASFTALSLGRRVLPTAVPDNVLGVNYELTQCPHIDRLASPIFVIVNKRRSLRHVATLNGLWNRRCTVRLKGDSNMSARDAAEATLISGLMVPDSKLAREQRSWCATPSPSCCSITLLV